MEIKVNGRRLSASPLVLGVQGDNAVEEIRFLLPRYTSSQVDLAQGIGYAVFRRPDGTDGQVMLTPETEGMDTISMTLLVGTEMTEQKGTGKLCLKISGLEDAMWSSEITDIFVGGTIPMPSPQPFSLFRVMQVGAPRVAEPTREALLTVTERTIIIPPELQTIAVAKDENSEKVRIVVPRYFDGVDLSAYDFILHSEMSGNGTDDILFNNTNGQMKNVLGQTVELTWVLRPPQTSFEGKLQIQLLVQGDQFKWHSLVGELSVARHLSGEPVVPSTPSMYEQWLAQIQAEAKISTQQAALADTARKAAEAAKNAASASADRAEKAAASVECKINDDAIASSSVWSSAKVVKYGADAYCDPFHQKGTVVQGKLVANYPADVRTLFAPEQLGTGDPSPSDIRPIKGVDSLMLTVCGRNVYSIEDATLVMPDRTKNTKLDCKCNGHLFFNASVSLGEAKFVTIVLNGKDGTQIFNDTAQESGKISIPFVSTSGVTKMHTAVPSTTAIPSTTRLTDIFLSAQENEKYEPYNGKDYAVQFGQTIYAGVMDWPSGKLTVTWVSETFDGSADEKIRFYKQNSTGAYVYSIDITDCAKGFNTSIANIFKNTGAIQAWERGAVWEYSDHDSLNRKYFCTDIPDSGADASAFRAWLAKNNLQVVYKLAAPRTIQLTAHEIRTLREITTFYSDKGDTEVSARLDPVAQRQGMSERITALEKAISPKSKEKII